MATARNSLIGADVPALIALLLLLGDIGSMVAVGTILPPGHLPAM